MTRQLTFVSVMMMMMMMVAKVKVKVKQRRQWKKTIRFDHGQGQFVEKKR